MTPQHIAFPSIEHFQKAKKQLKHYYKFAENDDVRDMQKVNLTLRGTVKLHGTHADIVFSNFCTDDEGTEKHGVVHFQSRNRIITKDKDNCGFARHMDTIGANELWTRLAEPALKIFRANLRPQDESSDEDDVTVHDNTNSDSVQQLMLSGEYCGGSIQKGVALSGLPTMFVIFAVKINGRYQDPYLFRDLSLPEQRVYNIFRIAPYRISFNLSACDELPDKLKQITDEVERECPYGKSFGVSGIGEGVVWCVEEHAHRTRFYFKVKGQEHSTSRVTTLKVKSAEELATLANARNFAELALPDARLQQGLDHLRELNLQVIPQNTSTFMQWVVNDVLKEEANEIHEAGLDHNKLKKELTSIALKFYKQKVDRRQLAGK